MQGNAWKLYLPREPDKHLTGLPGGSWRPPKLRQAGLMLSTLGQADRVKEVQPGQPPSGIPESYISFVDS